MTALRHRDFRRLWLAGLISDTGDWLLLVALPILVYQRTQSTLQTAFAFLVELGPAVLLGPFAGRLADRVDRRRLLATVVLAQAAVLLPLLVSTQLPVLYAVIAVEAALVTLFGPAKNALLPALVPDGELVSANALVGLNQNLGRLAGGPLGGLLLAVGDLHVIVLADLVTFLTAAALIAGIAARPAPARTAAGGSGPLGRVRLALVVAALAGIAQGIFVVLFVVWVARELSGGATETGLLRGVQAGGAIAAGVLLAALRRTPGPTVLVAAGAGVFGLLSFAVWNGPAVTTALPVYVALFVLVGAPGLVMVTGLVSFLQREAGEQARGRVFGVFGAVFDGASGVGMLAAGLLGDRLGIMALLNVQAALYLIAGLLFLLRRQSSSSSVENALASSAATATPTTAMPT
ncbi:MFS transporter [Dactylosporangium sp. AC04546]|uniref:MFS transporter n=1 Tax=Dactylosporangium sp. AC04546 TaxID=2862460 RepID=UPI001EDCAF09|nr:MFS transporter [Dactylosporangium sp. AC04546]WVK81555.1 MFS transporter [Dactylosporangium sp. AC04546]